MLCRSQPSEASTPSLWPFLSLSLTDGGLEDGRHRASLKDQPRGLASWAWFSIEKSLQPSSSLPLGVEQAP